VVSRVRILQAPPGHAGIVVPEQFEVRYAQVFAGAPELTVPDDRHFARVMAVLAWLDAPRSVTQISIRTRDDDGSHAPQRIVREDAAG
jgi:hypothetical protein